jgi:hypothetical protein
VPLAPTPSRPPSSPSRRRGRAWLPGWIRTRLDDLQQAAEGEGGVFSRAAWAEGWQEEVRAFWAGIKGEL